MSINKNNKKDFGMKLLIVTVFIVGIGLLLYPTICNIYNKWINQQEQINYKKRISANSTDKNKKMWKEAGAYNKEHTNNTIVDIFNHKSKSADTINYKYKNMLNPGNDGMMGYIEIPKIEQSISIFHGTGEKVLEKGVGHLAGTSLPAGGKSSHCVMAAHRGLPGAKLFTDLDQIRKGEKFYIHVLDKVLAYEINQIKVILPEKMIDYLGIIQGQDIVTLVTCTPYGVNSHRMLVRGHRVPMDKHVEKDVISKYIKYGILILVIILLLVIIYVWKKKRNKWKNSNEKR